MASISVQKWGYINTNMGKFSTGSVSYLVLAKHSDGGEWTSFLGAHFYRVATGGYLDRSGTVKCSHKWLVRSSRPWNPGKEAISRKKVSLHESFFFLLFFFPISSPAFPQRQLHVRVAVILARPFSASFTAAESLRPSRCRVAGAALGAERFRSSVLQSS